jgi:hypothetical protein
MSVCGTKAARLWKTGLNYHVFEQIDYCEAAYIQLSKSPPGDKIVHPTRSGGYKKESPELPLASVGYYCRYQINSYNGEQKKART